MIIFLKKNRIFVIVDFISLLFLLSMINYAEFNYYELVSVFFDSEFHNFNPNDED